MLVKSILKLIVLACDLGENKKRTEKKKKRKKKKKKKKKKDCNSNDVDDDYNNYDNVVDIYVHSALGSLRHSVAAQLARVAGKG